ncbi:MAG: DegV family protein [Betaproteobacteria bacterium]|nr:DegV family protein [Betaproteobacteria bacterium]
MSLRNGVVIDASAEITAEARNNPLLRVLPLHVQLDDRMLTDQREDALSHAVATTLLSPRTAATARSLVPRPDEIRRFFLDHVACDFDHAFGLFVSRRHSAVFDSAQSVMSGLIPESMAVRNRAGLRGPLFAECYDSQSVMSGYGVQVLDLLRMLDLAGSQAVLRQRLAQMAQSTYVYAVPCDLDFIRLRGRVTGDNSVSVLGQAAARYLGVLPVMRGHRGAFTTVAKVRGASAARDHIIRLAHRQLQRGLASPFVCLSYCGPLDEIQALDSFRALCRDAQAHAVAVTLNLMSPANAVNIGGGALSVGFIGTPHDPSL